MAVVRWLLWCSAVLWVRGQLGLAPELIFLEDSTSGCSRWQFNAEVYAIDSELDYENLFLSVDSAFPVYVGAHVSNMIECPRATEAALAVCNLTALDLYVANPLNKIVPTQTLVPGVVMAADRGPTAAGRRSARVVLRIGTRGAVTDSGSDIYVPDVPSPEDRRVLITAYDPIRDVYSAQIIYTLPPLCSDCIQPLLSVLRFAFNSTDRHAWGIGATYQTPQEAARASPSLLIFSSLVVCGAVVVGVVLSQCAGLSRRHLRMSLMTADLMDGGSAAVGDVDDLDLVPSFRNAKEQTSKRKRVVGGSHFDTTRHGRAAVAGPPEQSLRGVGWVECAQFGLLLRFGCVRGAVVRALVTAAPLLVAAGWGYCIYRGGVVGWIAGAVTIVLVIGYIALHVVGVVVASRRGVVLEARRPVPTLASEKLLKPPHLPPSGRSVVWNTACRNVEGGGQPGGGAAHSRRALVPLSSRFVGARLKVWTWACTCEAAHSAPDVSDSEAQDDADDVTGKAHALEPPQSVSFGALPRKPPMASNCGGCAPLLWRWTAVTFCDYNPTGLWRSVVDAILVCVAAILAGGGWWTLDCCDTYTYLAVVCCVRVVLLLLRPFDGYYVNLINSLMPTTVAVVAWLLAASVCSVDSEWVVDLYPLAVVVVILGALVRIVVWVMVTLRRLSARRTRGLFPLSSRVLAAYRAMPPPGTLRPSLATEDLHLKTAYVPTPPPQPSPYGAVPGGGSPNGSPFRPLPSPSVRDEVRIVARSGGVHDFPSPVVGLDHLAEMRAIHEDEFGTLPSRSPPSRHSSSPGVSQRALRFHRRRRQRGPYWREGSSSVDSDPTYPFSDVTLSEGGEEWEEEEWEEDEALSACTTDEESEAYVYRGPLRTRWLGERGTRRVGVRHPEPSDGVSLYGTESASTLYPSPLLRSLPHVVGVRDAGSVPTAAAVDAVGQLLSSADLRPQPWHASPPRTVRPSPRPPSASPVRVFGDGSRHSSPTMSPPHHLRRSFGGQLQASPNTLPYRPQALASRHPSPVAGPPVILSDIQRPTLEGEPIIGEGGGEGIRRLLGVDSEVATAQDPNAAVVMRHESPPLLSASPPPPPSPFSLDTPQSAAPRDGYSFAPPATSAPVRKTQRTVDAANLSAAVGGEGWILRGPRRESQLGGDGGAASRSVRPRSGDTAGLSAVTNERTGVRSYAGEDVSPAPVDVPVPAGGGVSGTYEPTAFGGGGGGSLSPMSLRAVGTSSPHAGGAPSVPSTPSSSVVSGHDVVPRPQPLAASSPPPVGAGRSLSAGLGAPVDPSRIFGGGGPGRGGRGRYR